MNIEARIRGHNNEWSAITRIRDLQGNEIGWKYQAACSRPKQYLAKYFHDPYGAAVAEMERHKHG